MKRRGWLIAGAAAAAAVAGASVALWRARRPQNETETAFWALRFERPEGGELSVSAFRGHPVLLNFWATWCAPCVTEMPLLDRFQRDKASRGWQVLGLAVDSPTPVRRFLTQNVMSFSIGLAGLEGVDLARSLGNASGALPFSVLFDIEGRAIARKLGALHPEDLEAWTRLID